MPLDPLRKKILVKLEDKIKLIIFDVDGVLTNSKKNMNLAFDSM